MKLSEDNKKMKKMKKKKKKKMERAVAVGEGNFDRVNEFIIVEIN